MELLRNEVVIKLTPMQAGMKRYCFKRNPDNVQRNLMRHDESLMQTTQMHDANSSELVLGHVENSSELVRYFEKLVEDEVSASNSSSKRKKKEEEFERFQYSACLPN